MGPRLTAPTLKVLATFLLRSDAELSGAEIGRTTGLQTGTLYPILFRLETAGWLESHWEAGNPKKLGRPRRRLYKITGLGINSAKTALREIVSPVTELAWS